MLYATEFTAAVYVTATAEDVRKGKLFVTSSGVLTEGTMGEALPEESSSSGLFTATSLTLFGRTTAEASDVREGKVFVDRTGAIVVGTYGASSSSQSSFSYSSSSQSSSSIVDSVTIYCDDIQNPPVIYYRTVQDGTPGEWILYNYGTVLNVRPHRIELKGEYWGDYENPCHFVTTGSVNSGGDIRSLAGDTVKHTGYLKGLFKNNPSLKSAPAVPYTELKEECFKEMFYNTGIKEAPYLPAINLVRDCYAYMFYNNRSLKKVSVGFTDWGDASDSTVYATDQWLCGDVPDTGIFIAPPALPRRTGDCNYIPWD